MHIELIGCTSAGKSRLIQRALRSNGAPGLRLATSYDFVLDWARLGWVRPRRARMLLLNLVALAACLLAWQKNREFYRFGLGVLRRLPARVGLAEKLKIARIAARNVGIYEIVSRHRREGQVILADEGTLHIANYLFVHAGVEPDLPALDHFTRLVALPDLAVYIRQPEAVLVSRTSRRGHGRIPGGAPELVGRFIRHSLVVFENLITDARLEDRLVILHGERVLAPGMQTNDDPRVALARQILAPERSN
jgi:hypothetical protein